MNYIQYGCGHHAPDDWLNFDSSPTILLERLPLVGRFCNKNSVRFPPGVRRGDILRGLPIPPGSAAGVYCSHTLEHLALDEFRTALRQTYALLRPGGIFRCVLPDLEYIIRAYLNDPSPNAAHLFMLDSMLGTAIQDRGIKKLLKSWLGRSCHLWMWDYKALEHELAELGFTAIRRAHLGDSEDRRFDSVESPERWINCLGLECRRPSSSP